MLNNDGGVQTLTFHGRRTAELTGGDLDVVGLERQNHIFHGQVVIGQLVGVDPDPHAELGAEIHHFANSPYPGQYLFKIRLGVVPQVFAAHAAIFRSQPDNNQEVSGGFADFDAGALHHIGKAGHGKLQLVLYLGPGDIRIRSWGEGHLDAGCTGRRTGAGEIEHIVQTGHFLLDDLGYGIFHRFRRGPREKGINGNGRRGDGRILGNGHFVDGQPTGRHYDDSNNPGKNRAGKKEFREHQTPPLLRF